MQQAINKQFLYPNKLCDVDFGCYHVLGLQLNDVQVCRVIKRHQGISVKSLDIIQLVGQYSAHTWTMSRHSDSQKHSTPPLQVF